METSGSARGSRACGSAMGNGGRSGDGGDGREVDRKQASLPLGGGRIGETIGPVRFHPDVQESEKILEKLIVFKSHVDIAGVIVQLFQIDRVVNHGGWIGLTPWRCSLDSRA